MENFVFYYTLFGNLNFAWAFADQNHEFSKQFLFVAKQLCELEAQTFLNDESVIELENIRNVLNEKIQMFEGQEYFGKKHVFPWPQWRIYIGLMCTFYEWCHETRFFELDEHKRAEIFPENPVDWYYNHHEFFKTNMDNRTVRTEFKSK